MIHTGASPHKYKECEEAFTYPRLLQRHERSHPREKTYACKEHGKAFSSHQSF
nr:PREDICTED: zinc finger protein 563-like [Equus przewalskii]